jgi:hypothetical protein
MGFLDNTAITVDAILTKKGRELLAKGQNEFNITKFALGDDEVDYTLWDVTHPNGTDYYGSVIENMPLLEASPDETQVMRYKLVTMPKTTARMPILELPSPSLAFNGDGITQTITPNTRNASDANGGYTFILHNSDLARMIPVSGASVETGATIPFFLSDADSKSTITVTASSVNLISKVVTVATTTQLTVVGNETGATYTIQVTVNPSPSSISV